MWIKNAITKLCFVIVSLTEHESDTGISGGVASTMIFLYLQVIFTKIRDPSLTMLQICRFMYILSTCNLLVPVVSQRLITAKFDQYHTVSTGAFTDMVAHNCEHRESRTNIASDCALVCSALGRPRCFAFVLSPGSCWLCGPDYGELKPTGDMIEATASLVYSCECNVEFRASCCCT